MVYQELFLKRSFVAFLFYQVLWRFNKVPNQKCGQGFVACYIGIGVQPGEARIKKSPRAAVEVLKKS